MKILIAEDDAISRRILQMAIEKFGHEVIQTGNGMEAWRAFDSEPVRIVISDWMMPELDGLGLCQKVRTRPETEYTYFILLTAKADAENYHMAMQAGIDDFLSKPMDRDELSIRLKVAERILGFTRRIQELEGLLPICSYCKKIRNEKQLWDQIEEYVAKQTHKSLSHSICPECYEIHVKPSLAEWKEKHGSHG